MICFSIVLVGHRFCSFCHCRYSLSLSFLWLLVHFFYLHSRKLGDLCFVDESPRSSLSHCLLNFSAWYLGVGSSASNFPLLFHNEIFLGGFCMKMHLPKPWEFFFPNSTLFVCCIIAVYCSLSEELNPLPWNILRSRMALGRDKPCDGLNVFFSRSLLYTAYALKYCVSTYYILASCDLALVDK